jgi:hypothetical protein
MFGNESDDDGDSGGPMKPGLFSGLRDIVSALDGDAKPQSLEDHLDMLPGTATIIADEGQSMAENSGSVALQRETFIVDVRPDDTTHPAIRAEVQCWVSWPDRPSVGDTVRAGYKPGTNEVALLLAGDPKWDWQLAAARKQSNDATQREELLNSPPGTPVPNPDPDGT